MLGAIVGDTVGSIYEFNNTKDYNFEMVTRERMIGILVVRVLFRRQS